MREEVYGPALGLNPEQAGHCLRDAPPNIYEIVGRRVGILVRRHSDWADYLKLLRAWMNLQEHYNRSEAQP